MKEEKGVTILVLVIMVVLMVIIAGIAVNYGGNTLNTMKLQNFKYELEQIQGKVDTLYEKIKLGDVNYITLGSDITDSPEAVATLKKVKTIDYSDMTDSQREEYYYQGTYTSYRYLTEDNLQSLLGITSRPGDFIINFQTREVISVNGFPYDGWTYYTLDDFEVKLYNSN